MAERFTPEVCQGDGCKETASLSYNMVEKKRLCHGCIEKARKTRSYRFCEKHSQEINIYCQAHNKAICVTCASIDHHHKDCVRKDLDDAILENKEKLYGLKHRAEGKLQQCRAYSRLINRCRSDADEHLKVVKNDIDSVIDEARKEDKAIEKEAEDKINYEIDEKNRKLREEISKLTEQINKNNVERKERLEANRTNTRQRREPIDKKQRDLHCDVTNIAEETESEISKLEESCKDYTTSIENAIQTIDTTITDDNNMITNGHRVNESVSDVLKRPLDEGGVKHVTDTVSGVRFVKGAGREKYNGRIDGYDGEWRLADTINIGDDIEFPVIVGCIDESKVIITDGCLGRNRTYMLDMNTKHTQRVITGSDTSWVDSCALLNDDKVVCGKERKGCTGDSLTRCISVYDRQWKLINDVTIPRNTTYDDDSLVDVAADPDGMIIAAEACQSKIYVINPADGKIIHTITCKQEIWMLGVLSSGHIIAQPAKLDHRWFIINREGAQREITHSGKILDACIDPVTDDIYVVTSDDEAKTCVIDHVMSGGDMKKRSVASFPLSTELTNRLGHLGSSRVMMTSSGSIIASDGDNILLFKKTYRL